MILFSIIYAFFSLFKISMIKKAYNLTKKNLKTKQLFSDLNTIDKFFLFAGFYQILFTFIGLANHDFKFYSFWLIIAKIVSYYFPRKYIINKNFNVVSLLIVLIYILNVV